MNINMMSVFAVNELTRETRVFTSSATFLLSYIILISNLPQNLIKLTAYSTKMTPTSHVGITLISYFSSVKHYDIWETFISYYYNRRFNVDFRMKLCVDGQEHKTQLIRRTIFCKQIKRITS